jgi:hypothetical protein
MRLHSSVYPVLELVPKRVQSGVVGCYEKKRAGEHSVVSNRVVAIMGPTMHMPLQLINNDSVYRTAKRGVG